MSQRTTRGAGDVSLGTGEATERDLATRVADALSGETPTAIRYRANTGSLDEPDDVWEELDSIDDLGERTLDGWDELYVFTESHVYRWVGVGFDAGPERMPRHPAAVAGER